MSLKEFIASDNLDESRVLNITLGDGGELLPCPSPFTGYIINIGDEAVTFYHDKLGVKTDVRYAAFASAEFGIGSGNLWLQCTVNGSPLVFCMPRKLWKSEKAKLLMEKISAFAELKGKKEYDGFTGKLFLLYMLK